MDKISLIFYYVNGKKFVAKDVQAADVGSEQISYTTKKKTRQDIVDKIISAKTEYEQEFIVPTFDLAAVVIKKSRNKETGIQDISVRSYRPCGRPVVDIAIGG